MSIAFTFVPEANSESSSFFYEPRAVRDGLAQARRAGFTGVVVDDPGGLLTNFDVTAEVAAAHHGLQVFMTHWAGVMEPVVAAREIVALSARCRGRLGLRILPNGTNGDAESGMRITHTEAWRQTNEYVDNLNRGWLTQGAVPVRSANSTVTRLAARFTLPIRMGGQSGTALQVAARHADIFELAPGALFEVGVLIDRVKTAAAHYGRSDKIRFALPIRISRSAARTAGAARFLPPAENLAAKINAYADVGVTEFMVVGAESFEAVRAYLGGTETVQPLLHRAARLRTAGVALIAAASPAGRKAPASGRHRQAAPGR